MQESIHSMQTLFDQLGLESSEAAIDQFINKHKPIPAKTKIHEADFWNQSQAAVLEQFKDEDADWVIFVDDLDARLR